MATLAIDVCGGARIAAPWGEAGNGSELDRVAVPGKFTSGPGITIDTTLKLGILGLLSRLRLSRFHAALSHRRGCASPLASTTLTRIVPKDEVAHEPGENAERHWGCALELR